MPVTMKRVDLATAKILETPQGGSQKEVTEINDFLADAFECYHGQFKVAASAIDEVVSLGNIITAKVFILVADGPMTTKLNGAAVDVGFTTLILFNTDITGVTVSNPDLSNSRTVEIYIATDSD